MIAFLDKNPTLNAKIAWQTQELNAKSVLVASYIVLSYVGRPQQNFTQIIAHKHRPMSPPDPSKTIIRLA